MLIQNRPGHCFRSRRISSVHARTNLTALAIVRLSVLPRQGITVYSPSLDPSVSSTNRVGSAMAWWSPIIAPTIDSKTYRGGTGFDHAVAVAIDST